MWPYLMTSCFAYTDSCVIFTFKVTRQQIWNSLFCSLLCSLQQESTRWPHCSVYAARLLRFSCVAQCAVLGFTVKMKLAGLLIGELEYIFGFSLEIFELMSFGRYINTKEDLTKYIFILLLQVYHLQVAEVQDRRGRQWGGLHVPGFLSRRMADE